MILKRISIFFLILINFFAGTSVFAASSPQAEPSSENKIVGPEIQIEEESEDSVSEEEDGEDEEIETASKVSYKSFKNQPFGKPVESTDVFETAVKKTPSGKVSAGGPKKSVLDLDRKAPKKTETTMGRFKMSGKYRLAAGADSEDLILNDANADLYERNFRYVFGEKLNNTYDPAVYSQYLLNIDFAPADKFNFYTQIVVDPWSYVGTTGEQTTNNQLNPNINVRYNLKYFGALNSTLNEGYRTSYTDLIGFPIIKVHHGHLTKQTLQGFDDYDGVSGDGKGLMYNIPEVDLDMELRPFRKMWMDYTEENWHLRVFPLASQDQALTTDDPLILSNRRDFWQESPWLYQYHPIQFFTDHSIKRGYYDNQLAYLAKDSEGNRLVLLRGVSFEGMKDNTYLAATVAAPYTPWDDDFFEANNIPGAVRLKHQATDRLMVGGVYTFRSGLINSSVADFNQVVGADIKYKLNEHSDFKGEVAGSQTERDLLTDERIKADADGMAYRAIIDSEFKHKKTDGKTNIHLSFTQMDQRFNPNLSNYKDTHDDDFWGKHLTFNEISPDLDAFRIGDGIDINRRTYRFQWKESLYKDRFVNLFDNRHVRRTSTNAFKENVLREELTYKATSRLTFKGMFRWHHLPQTLAGVEPFLSDYYFATDNFANETEDSQDRILQNLDVAADKDPSRFTYAGAAQYVFNPKWTVEGYYEVTNDLSNFPRGLLNSVYRSPNDVVDGLLNDHLTAFLYGQGHLGGAPPYEYNTVTRQRIYYRPDNAVLITFHAAQNGYKYAGGIDDNINHQGVSVTFMPGKKYTVFFDYTHSLQIDLPRLIATNYVEHDFGSHHNVYASFDYRINAATVFRAEYGVFGLGKDTPLVTPYSVTDFSLPTIDTEQIVRVSLTGDF